MKPRVLVLSQDAEWSALLDEYFEETSADYRRLRDEAELRGLEVSCALVFLETALVRTPELFKGARLVKLGAGEVKGLEFSARVDKGSGIRDFERIVPALVPDISDELAILLVDDDEELRGELKGYWESCARPKTRVETASNGLEAFERLRSFRPDCIIADLKMPGLGGAEFYKRLRAQDKATPVIILSAVSEAGEVAELKRIGRPICIEKSSEESRPDSLRLRAFKLKVFGSRDSR